MSISNTPRFALTQWSAGSDPPVTRAQLNGDNLTLDQQAAGYLLGLASARPAATAAVAGFHYWATDTEVLSFCDGDEWADVITAQAPYTAWTPVVTQGGGSLALSTNTSRRLQQGKRVHAVGVVTVNAAGSSATTINATLPVAGVFDHAATDRLPIGSCLVEDVSDANGVFFGHAVMVQGGAAVRFQREATLNGASIGVNPAFTLAAGDRIWFNASYEVA